MSEHKDIFVQSLKYLSAEIHFLLANAQRFQSFGKAQADTVYSELEAFTNQINGLDLDLGTLNLAHSCILMLKDKIQASFYADVITTASDRDFDLGHINENIKLFKAHESTQALKPAFDEISFEEAFQ